MEANHVLHWPTGARRFRSGLSKAVRLAASAGLLALLIAPAATAPETALADNNLNWEGIRPPSTRASSTNLPYTSLDRFGTSADLAMGTIPPQHELVIAPNGDIFTSGKSSAGAAAPPVFKSTDGGKSWNQSVALTPGTVITGLAVSPKYPGDNVVFASYSDGAAGVNNGVALSTDGGSTFTTVADFGAGASNALSLANGNRNGAATPVLPVNGGTPFNVTALSVSPNFDNSTGAGAVVLAGGGPDGTDIAYQLAIASGGAVNTASGNTRPLRFTGGSFASGTVNSIAVAFSPDFSNDGVIGLLYSCTGAVDGANTRCPALGTYVSRFSAGAFTMPNTTSDNLGVTGGGGFVATTGGLAFPTDYRDVTGGGTYYAATGNGAVVGSGDVYKRTGGFWNGMGRSADFGSMAISGMSSNVNILAAVDSTGMGGSGINLVHRSTSAGDSFTTTQALDGEKYLLNVTGGANAVAMTSDYATTGVAYATLPGTLGGVVKSTNRGSNWVDTGLTNEAFTTVQAIFFAATAPGGFAKMTDGVNSALFWTDNVSTTSTWVRVHRSLGSLTYIVPPDYSTARTLYAFSSTVTSAMIIKSTNSGRSWDTISSDPSSDGRIMTMEAVSAARLMVGDDRGRVWNSSDGGGSWTQATGTLGQRITSIRMLPDFGTMNTVAVGAIAGGAPEVFLSEDGGVTFKQVGSNLAAWGATSNSTMGLTIRNDSEYHANKMLYVRCDTCSDTDVWRIAVGKETSFTRLGVPSNIRPVGLHTFIGSVLYLFGLNPTVSDPGAGAAACVDADPLTLCSGSNTVHRTSSAATVTDGAWNKLAAVSPPVLVGGVQARAFGAVSDSTNGTAGAMMWMAANNPAAITNAAAATQILGITFTSGFLTAPILTMPPDKTSVATNVGSQGTPTTFTWTSSGRAQCYDFQLALDKDFSQLLVDPINGVGACPVATAGVASNASLTIANSGTDSNTVTVTALVQGNTYWWRVRVRSIGLTSPGALGQGPWSQPSSFAVANQGAPLSPQPQLPANGSTVLDLATTLRWNNPAGTVQHQLQVIPLNYDGPGIDLVISEPAMVAGASFDVLAPVMGQGNYVILPGATYNWRIRTTTKSGSLSPVDPSWGPWSAIWTFKTPRPNAASITLASVTPSATPTLTWRDIRASNFYYEVQLSQDKTFNNDPITATAAVYWNLVHGGVTTPLNSWTVPPGVSLEKGKTYWWRVRQRVQATELGAEELGVGWTAPASFIVP